jgi:hypothetical protein
MEDFNDTAQRAVKALVAAELVEEETRSTGEGVVLSGSATPLATGEDVGPSGSDAPLETSPPEPVTGVRDHHLRDPLTYPTHHTRAAQRVAVAARRREHQGPP